MPFGLAAPVDLHGPVAGSPPPENGERRLREQLFFCQACLRTRCLISSKNIENRWQGPVQILYKRPEIPANTTNSEFAISVTY